MARKSTFGPGGCFLSPSLEETAAPRSRGSSPGVFIAERRRHRQLLRDLQVQGWELSMQALLCPAATVSLTSLPPYPGFGLPELRCGQVAALCDILPASSVAPGFTPPSRTQN